MDDFDNIFTESIVNKLTLRLGRNLTQDECSAFKLVRSGIAYEMMMNFITDEEKSMKEIEDYVEEVINENKKSTNNNGRQSIEKTRQPDVKAHLATFCYGG